MFRRENRKSFGETEKLFRSKPSSQKGFGTRLELFGGCRKCSGTFQNFSGENGREKLDVPGRGTRSHDSWAVFNGAPPLGGNPHLVEWMLGAPHGGGQAPHLVEHVWGGGAPMREPQRVAGPRLGAPHGASSHLWWVALWEGAPFGPSSSCLPSTPCPHYK